jgi:hypothetical protein
MSGGASGLGGYIFQQRYLTLKVLSSVAAQLLEDSLPQAAIKKFGLESRGSPTAPAWDARFVLHDDSVHLRECKNTDITRDDREVFYRRVRRELNQGTQVERLHVGWVTDPEKQGNILDHIAEMGTLCRTATLAIPNVIYHQASDPECQRSKRRCIVYVLPQLTPLRREPSTKLVQFLVELRLNDTGCKIWLSLLIHLYWELLQPALAMPLPRSLQEN